MVPQVRSAWKLYAVGGQLDNSSGMQAQAETGVSGTEGDDLLAECWAAVSAKRDDWHSQAMGVGSDFKTVTCLLHIASASLLCKEHCAIQTATTMWGQDPSPRLRKVASALHC